MIFLVRWMIMLDFYLFSLSKQQPGHFLLVWLPVYLLLGKQLDV